MTEAIETRYAIARECTAEGYKFTVVYVTRHNVSDHKTIAEARAAIARYQAADNR